MAVNLRLDWCDHKSAKYAVEHWHYSGQMPNQKTVKVGVWEDRRFVGAIVFGDGANNRMFEPYGLGYTEGAELVRVALTCHATSVTRMVAIALRMLRARCPGLRLVISFADPEQGHIGAIYQAGNWVYAGMTTPADEYMVNGVRMHGRALRSTRSTHAKRDISAANIQEWARKVLDPNTYAVKGSAKYRYLMPLDDEIRQRIEPLRKPYPKRVGSRENAVSAIHAGEGGVIPTPALQEAVCG